MTSFCGSDNDENDYEIGYRDGIKAGEARVAELEAALRTVVDHCCLDSDHAAVDIARAALAEVDDAHR